MFDWKVAQPLVARLAFLQRQLLHPGEHKQYSCPTGWRIAQTSAGVPSDAQLKDATGPELRGQSISRDVVARSLVSMSFGFGVGDFLAVGQLVLTLYNACNGAAGELLELQKDLSSLHILISGLELQAQDPKSLLRRKGADKRPEWLQLRDNMESTLKELQDLVKRYEKMDRKAWLRVQLGLKNLTDLRAKLAFHLQAMNNLFGGITLSSLGRLEAGQARMEEQLGKFDAFMSVVAPLLLQSVSEERAGHKAPTVLSAQEKGNGPEWDRMKMELVVAGVSKEGLDQNMERIREVLDWAVNNGPDLDDLREVQVDDSISCHDSLKEEAPTPSSSQVAPDNAHKNVPAPAPERKDPDSLPIRMRTPPGENCLKILIIDDTLGHFGVMFEYYLRETAKVYRFGPKPPSKRGEIGRQWLPEFAIDLCGANADGSYIMDRKRDARLKAVLRKQGNITWRPSFFRPSSFKSPDDYDYILIVPPTTRKEQRGSDVRTRIPVPELMAPPPVLVVTSVRGTDRKRTLLGPVIDLDKTFQVIDFSIGRVDVKDFSPLGILPYSTSTFTVRSDKYYFEKSAAQVRACVRGFIEEELHGVEPWKPRPRV